MFRIDDTDRHKILWKASFLLVSYTTDDLVFDWEETVPLAVDDNIELPQLDLVATERGDCTQVYSTGKNESLNSLINKERMYDCLQKQKEDQNKIIWYVYAKTNIVKFYSFHKNSYILREASRRLSSIRC